MTVFWSIGPQSGMRYASCTLSRPTVGLLASVWICKSPQWFLVSRGYSRPYRDPGANQDLDLSRGFYYGSASSEGQLQIYGAASLRSFRSWQANALSIMGRMTLVRSILSSIPVYVLVNMFVPSFCLRSLEHLFQNFLWDSMHDGRGIHLLS